MTNDAIDEPAVRGRHLPPGTPVRYDGLRDVGPEYGVVVHCWLDRATGDHDCYVAFFGDRPPEGEPPERPYMLRYASSSLTVLPCDPRA